MINQIYRLVTPRQFEITYKDYSIRSDKVIVRPTHLSICEADKRYYIGARDKEILSKKLPMALIHEAIGVVVYDPKKIYKVGDAVVLIPNTPVEENDVISENYLRSSKFKSSGCDGFMQDYVFMRHDRLVKIPKDLDRNIAAFLELISVSIHCITRFEKKANIKRDTLGIWGDGNLGFITALILKKKYPYSKIMILGKNENKLNYFSFADEVYYIDEVPKNFKINHGFECVGGKGSRYAINQMIEYITPEGCISLMGVSEEEVEINTRMLLEKGLTMVGSSRSGREDFINAISFLEEYKGVQEYLENLIGSVNIVRTINDIIEAFEQSLTSIWGKFIMKWDI